VTWRLVLGVVALQWRSILGPLVMVTLFSRSNGMPGWLAGGLPLLFVVATGVTTISSLSQRALVVLPVGPKDLNRTTWVLAVILPLVLLTVGRCLAASVDGLFADQWSWVYPASPVRVFYECLFLALVGVWSVNMPDRHQPDFRADSRLWLKILIMVGAMAVPFIVIPLLPSTFGAISPIGWPRLCCWLSDQAQWSGCRHTTVAHRSWSSAWPSRLHRQADQRPRLWPHLAREDLTPFTGCGDCSLACLGWRRCGSR